MILVYLRGARGRLRPPLSSYATKNTVLSTINVFGATRQYLCPSICVRRQNKAKARRWRCREIERRVPHSGGGTFKRKKESGETEREREK